MAVAYTAPNVFGAENVEGSKCLILSE